MIVTYDGPYAKIAVRGQTQLAALQRAKKLGGLLMKAFPTATLFIPRKKIVEEGHCYEVRVSLVKGMKAFISALVLKGDL